MPEHYEPGPRNKRFKSGTVPDSNYAWLDFHLGKFIILVGDKQTNEVQPGDDVVLYWPRPGKIPNVSIPLTDLTREELDQLKELIDLAYEWAGPTVDERDEVAEHAFQNGDDSVTRKYRRLPSLVVRKRPGGEHGEGIHGRPEGIPEGVRRRGNREVRIRGTRSELASDESQQGQPQDNGETIDKP
jgi:hypothetical protein